MFSLKRFIIGSLIAFGVLVPALVYATVFVVPQGGTGLQYPSTGFQSNTILIGNGVNAIATTTPSSDNSLNVGSPLTYSINTANSNTWVVPQYFTADTQVDQLEININHDIHNSLSVYDTFGNLVFSVVNSIVSAGSNVLNDGSNNAEIVGILKADTQLGVATTSPWAVLSVNSTAGLPQFAIGSSTGTQFLIDKNGLVGIGTTSPSAALAVTGGFFTTASSTGMNGINLTGGCFSVRGVCITGGGGGGSGTVSSGTQGQFPFYNSAGTTLTATSSLFITQQGNVGIGTTTPSYALTVQGSIVAVGAVDNGDFAIKTKNGNGFWDFATQQSANGNFVFYDGVSNLTPFVLQKGAPNSSFYLNTAGNIGLGISSPSADLEIATGTGTGDSSMLRLNRLGAMTAGNEISIDFFNTLSYNAGRIASKVDPTGTGWDMAFYTKAGAAPALAEGMRLTRLGLLGVGSTSPWGQISASNSSAAPALAVQNTGTGYAGSFIGASQAAPGITGVGGDLVLGNPPAGQAALSFGHLLGGYAWSQSWGGLPYQINPLGNNLTLCAAGTDCKFGIGSSSPQAQLSVSGIAGTPSFLIGSSTGTQFTVDKRGYVGINTATPSTDLDIERSAANNGIVGMKIVDTAFPSTSAILMGSIKWVDGSFVEPQIWFGANANSPSFTNYAFNYDASNGTILNTPSGQLFQFRVGNSTGATLGTNGFAVGIAANSSPAYLFQVHGSSNDLIVTSAGNVGVGTTSPFTTFAVNGTTTSNIYQGTGRPTITKDFGYTDATVGFDAGANNFSGTVEILTAAAVANNSRIFTINFSSPYSYAPHCTFSPATLTAAANATTIYATTSPTGMSLLIGSPSLTTTTDYKWTYICVQ